MNCEYDYKQEENTAPSRWQQRFGNRTSALSYQVDEDHKDTFFFDRDDFFQNPSDQFNENVECNMKSWISKLETQTNALENDHHYTQEDRLMESPTFQDPMFFSSHTRNGMFSPEYSSNDRQDGKAKKIIDTWFKVENEAQTIRKEINSAGQYSRECKFHSKQNFIPPRNPSPRQRSTPVAEEKTKIKPSKDPNLVLNARHHHLIENKEKKKNQTPKSIPENHLEGLKNQENQSIGSNSTKRKLEKNIKYSKNEHDKISKSHDKSHDKILFNVQNNNKHHKSTAPTIINSMRIKKMVAEKENKATLVKLHQTKWNKNCLLVSFATWKRKTTHVLLAKSLKKEQFQMKQVVLSTWISMVNTRQKQLEKAIQTDRWRCLTSTWKEWTVFQMKIKTERVRLKLEEEENTYDKAIVLAQNFFSKATLSKCFLSWIIYVHTSKEERQVEDSQIKRQEKTMLLLESLRQGNQITIPNKEMKENSWIKTNIVNPKKNFLNANDQLKESTKFNPNHANPLLPPTLKCDFTTPLTTTTTKKSKRSAPKAYLAMNERIAERKERREALKKKYADLAKEKEEEKQRQVLEEEEKRNKEKADLILKKKMEKKAAQMKVMQLELEKHAWREKLKLSQLHYSFSLVKYHGFLPWVQLHQRCKLQWTKAYNVWKDQLFHKCFHHWIDFLHHKKLQQRLKEKEKHQKDLLLAQLMFCRRFWKNWKHLHQCYKMRSFRDFLALDCYVNPFLTSNSLWDYRSIYIKSRENALLGQTKWCTLKRCWNQWQYLLRQELLFQHKLMTLVKKNTNKRIQQSSLTQWKNAVRLWNIEREMEQEKAKTWEKVRSWLNEYPEEKNKLNSGTRK